MKENKSETKKPNTNNQTQTDRHTTNTRINKKNENDVFWLSPTTFPQRRWTSIYLLSHTMYKNQLTGGRARGNWFIYCIYLCIDRKTPSTQRIEKRILRAISIKMNDKSQFPFHTSIHMQTRKHVYIVCIHIHIHIAHSIVNARFEEGNFLIQKWRAVAVDTIQQFFCWPLLSIRTSCFVYAVCEWLCWMWFALRTYVYLSSSTLFAAINAPKPKVCKRNSSSTLFIRCECRTHTHTHPLTHTCTNE